MAVYFLVNEDSDMEYIFAVQNETEYKYFQRFVKQYESVLSKYIDKRKLDDMAKAIECLCIYEGNDNETFARYVRSICDCSGCKDYNFVMFRIR